MYLGGFTNASILAAIAGPPNLLCSKYISYISLSTDIATKLCKQLYIFLTLEIITCILHAIN